MGLDTRLITTRRPLPAPTDFDADHQNDRELCSQRYFHGLRHWMEGVYLAKGGQELLPADRFAMQGELDDGYKRAHRPAWTRIVPRTKFEGQILLNGQDLDALEHAGREGQLAFPQSDPSSRLAQLRAQEVQEMVRLGREALDQGYSVYFSCSW